MVGHKLNSQSVDCKTGFAIDFNKEDFIGKSALLMQRRRGLRKRLVNFMIDIEDAGCHPQAPLPWGGEPIFRDDKVRGGAYNVW